MSTKINRRAFLRRGCQLVLGGGAGATLTGCPKAPLSPVDARSEVAVVRGRDLAVMTRNALDALGGASAIVNPGDNVFIKPNFGGMGMVKYNPIAVGDSAKPEIVMAAAEECLKAGAASVTIGEAGQVGRWDWNVYRFLDDSKSVAEAALRLNALYGERLTLACLNDDSPGWDSLPSYNRRGKVLISRLLTQADKIISIPVLKTHRWTQITGALKNFVGTTPVRHYGFAGGMRMALHSAGLEQSFLDIVRGLRPNFTIIDCSVCCEGNGPHVLPGYWGETVDMRDRLGDWLILASKDLVAADATAARIIEHDVAKISHLQMAYEQGLGQIQEDRIEILGEPLDRLRVAWKFAEPTRGFAEVLIPGIHLLTDAS